jgi:hypothetical protein
LRLESAEQAEEIERQAERQEDESADPSTLRILDYVRRKEAQRWVANRERDREPDPRDW